MQRFKLVIEYHGTPFSGWQRQKDVPSVQGVIEEAIRQFDPRTEEQKDILVYGTGRTDAGVHAKAMVAHADIYRDMQAYALMSALNFYVLPHPVSILSVEPVAADFHARFSAKSRHYLYRILNRQGPPSYQKDFCWHIINPLDAGRMQAAAQMLVGRHDFTTFRHIHCQSKSPVKNLDYLEVSRNGDYIEIRTGARSFLHNQVRGMVGCLKLVGEGKWTAADLKGALDAQNRQALGMNAPAAGLFFERADF